MCIQIYFYPHGKALIVIPQAFLTGILNTHLAELTSNNSSIPNYL